MKNTASTINERTDLENGVMMIGLLYENVIRLNRGDFYIMLDTGWLTIDDTFSLTILFYKMCR